MGHSAWNEKGAIWGFVELCSRIKISRLGDTSIPYCFWNFAWTGKILQFSSTLRVVTRSPKRPQGIDVGRQSEATGSWDTRLTEQCKARGFGFTENERLVR